MFIFAEAGTETNDELVEFFDNLPYKNKVIITNKEYINYKSAKFLDIYGADWAWGKLIKIKPHTLCWKRYIDEFDYVSWLNTGIVKH